MKIAINGLQRILLHKLLMLNIHKIPYGQTQRHIWRNCRGDDSAITLLNRLEEDEEMDNLLIDGYERELLLCLLASELVKQLPSSSLEKNAKRLFESLQPQGAPIGSDVGDIIESRADGEQYEVVHFHGAFHASCYGAGGDTGDFVLSSTGASKDQDDQDFVHLGIGALMWPPKKSPEQLLWG